MYKKTITLITLTFIILSTTQLFADGKFYISDDVPPDLPYQRAIIIFDDTNETLVLQSKFEFESPDDITSFGWIVPLPTPPKISALDPDSAMDLFSRLAFATNAGNPKLTHVSEIIFFATMIVAFIALALIIIIKWRQRKTIIMPILLLLLILFFVVIFLPALSKARIAGIDILNDKQVGIYNTKTIAADNSDDLINWLNTNNFNYNDADKTAFDQYIAQGWCFVTAKISPDARNKEISHNGLIAPLVLTFPTTNPVYPLALTATADQDTEVLIYLISKHKMLPGSPIEMFYANMQDESNKRILELFDIYMQLTENPDAESYAPSIPNPTLTYLTKFKQTLTPTQMQSDLTFTPAPDDTPYRRGGHRIVW